MALAPLAPSDKRTLLSRRTTRQHQHRHKLWPDTALNWCPPLSGRYVDTNTKLDPAAYEVTGGSHELTQTVAAVTVISEQTVVVVPFRIMDARLMADARFPYRQRASRAK